jgi:hypothetical protein
MNWKVIPFSRVLVAVVLLNLLAIIASAPYLAILVLLVCSSNGSTKPPDDKLP